MSAAPGPPPGSPEKGLREWGRSLDARVRVPGAPAPALPSRMKHGHEQNPLPCWFRAVGLKPPPSNEHLWSREASCLQAPGRGRGPGPGRDGAKKPQLFRSRYHPQWPHVTAGEAKAGGDRCPQGGGPARGELGSLGRLQHGASPCPQPAPTACTCPVCPPCHCYRWPHGPQLLPFPGDEGHIFPLRVRAWFPGVPLGGWPGAGPGSSRRAWSGLAGPQVLVRTRSAAQYVTLDRPPNPPEPPSLCL